MKKGSLALLALIILMGAGAYAGRGVIRDRWDALRAPVLPKAKPFTPPVTSASNAVPAEPSPIEGGPSKSEHYTLISSPTPSAAANAADPMAVNGPLPDELNLDVPFTIQAPEQNWDMPYEEACEEASITMVDAYYHGQTDRLPIDLAKRTILDLVDYENKTFGDFKHTTVAQTGKMAMDFFKLPDARSIPVKSANDIKRLLANGFPVIVPAAGRELGNPNFKTPGPIYHMFVIKGYTKDGMFITDEPGTRKGHDFVYSYDTVMNAMHDYDATDMDKGAKVVLILFPSTP